jgi:pantoate--beta-alanine ligase
LHIFTTISEIQKYLADKTNISLVPTMGGLHQGHLSLIQIAQQHSQLVVVSIFLNPAQFGKNEDLDSYPQSLQEDIHKLQAQQVDVLFAPNVDEIYPKNYSFSYDIGYLGTILCAKSRPQFFPGIVKVVYRLFDIIKPNIAIFGKKDYQQLMIITQMIQGFKLPIKIIAGELIREPSGLALSTRNNYLTSAQKTIASNIYTYLTQAKTRIQNGEQLADIHKKLTHNLQQDFTLDYCEIMDSQTLGKITPKTTSIVILIAAMLGKTRLIDNMEFSITHYTTEEKCLQ